MPLDTGGVEEGGVQLVDQQKVPCAGQSRTGDGDDAVVVAFQQQVEAAVVALDRRR